MLEIHLDVKMSGGQSEMVLEPGEQLGPDLYIQELAT